MGRGRSNAAPLSGAQAASSLSAAPADSEAVDHEAVIRAVPSLRGRHLPLVCLVGSHAYGLATPESDYDYRGIYLAKTTEVVGLNRVAEQLESKDPDLTCFELEKFCRLALAANPNVLEILWADPLIEDPIGARLREIRGAFLSGQARGSYVGYAHAQLKRAIGVGEVDRRRPKSIRHLFRLYEQGEQLLTTGQLTVRLSDPERIRSYETMNDEQLRREFERLDARVKTMDTVLPAMPDIERVNALVIQIRTEQLEARAA